jgi:hypothetical protein
LQAVVGAPVPHAHRFQPETHMSNPTQAARGGAAPDKPAPTFLQMGFFQKIVFVGKVAIFFATLGFAYPNVLLD